MQINRSPKRCSYKGADSLGNPTRSLRYSKGLPAMRLSFLGGAGTVTGSKYALEHNNHRVLVDCGLFQGFKALRLKNWAPFPIEPRSIGTVVLTHAHLDHSGYLPLLIRRGFAGPVVCSRATIDLCAILLPDSGHLQEKDAEFANRHRFSKHKPALPLYTEADARAALKHLTPIAFDETRTIPGGATIRLRRAGHILGAASVQLDWAGLNVVFSGDLGRYNDPTMVEPVAVERADVLLVESTYGNRRHEQGDPSVVLEQIVSTTAARGGTVVIPAFAVGRAQSLLFYFYQLKSRGVRYPSIVRWRSMRAKYFARTSRIISYPKQSAGGLAPSAITCAASTSRRR